MLTSTHGMAAINVDSNMLYSVCESLHVTLDKFIIVDPGHSGILARPTGLPRYRVLKDSYDPSGLQTVELGHLDDIYRKHYCPFCRLVFEATHGDTVPGIGVDGLSGERKRVKCYMAWQLDARVQDISLATNAGVANLTVKTRRIRILSLSNMFPDAYISLLDEFGEASSYLG